MSGIPEDIMEKAQVIAYKLGDDAVDSNPYDGDHFTPSRAAPIIAAALLAERESAYNQGAREEREEWEFWLKSRPAEFLRTPSEQQAVRKAIKEGREHG